jgi:hypothetical protein
MRMAPSDLPLLAKHEVPPSDAELETVIRLGDRTGGVRVRCPVCAWVPKATDRWSCRCGHAWNTFDTGGVCPACRFHWAITQCLRCHAFSPHEDWYVREPGSSAD